MPECLFVPHQIATLKCALCGCGRQQFQPNRSSPQVVGGGSRYDCLSFLCLRDRGGGRTAGLFCLYLSLYVPECLSLCQNRSPHSRVSLCGSERNQSSHTGQIPKAMGGQAVFVSLALSSHQSTIALSHVCVSSSVQYGSHPRSSLSSH